MKIKILNRDKNERKYKYFLTAFYILICFFSLKQIISLLSENFLKSSQLTWIPITKWTLQMYINPLIGIIIAILSIIIIILVFMKKLPMFNLVYPVYYLLFILFWDYLLPRITRIIASSIGEFIRWINIQDNCLIIFLIIDFLFSSWFLLKLWDFIKGGKNK
jgi:hypothetical protein